MNHSIYSGTDIVEGEINTEDLTMLKKKLKAQQSLFSERIKTVADPQLKFSARSIHNEISKLRRKNNDSHSILELLEVSAETYKIVTEQRSVNDLIFYNSLSSRIKQKTSRAWKLLAGAMIAFSLIISQQLNQNIPPSRR